MPRLQFRIRGLLLVVAMTAVALACCVVQFGGRRQAMQALALRHAGLETSWRAEAALCLRLAEAFETQADGEDKAAGDLERRHPPLRVDADLLRKAAASWRGDAAGRRERADAFSRRAVYHGDLRQKYDRCARRPWSIVPPDPPPPPLLALE